MVSKADLTTRLKAEVIDLKLDLAEARAEIESLCTALNLATSTIALLEDALSDLQGALDVQAEELANASD